MSISTALIAVQITLLAVLLIFLGLLNYPPARDNEKVYRFIFAHYKAVWLTGLGSGTLGLLLYFFGY